MWRFVNIMAMLPVVVHASSTASATMLNPTARGLIARNPEQLVYNASEVNDCLTSVPFNPAVASRLIKYVNDTTQFHSTLAHLANPPRGYQQPAVDLVTGLLAIQHGGILDPFSFASPYQIVSVSLDGKELPKIYIAEDILANMTGGNLPWQPSALKRINGEDAVEYLTHFAEENSHGKLEAHADWSILMRSAALDVQEYPEVFFGGAPIYPGDSLNFEFEHRTTLPEIPWLAIFYDIGGTGPLETGGDFYNRFVLGFYPAGYDPDDIDPPALTSTVVKSASPTPTPSSDPWNPYPTPDILSNKSISLEGYFLREPPVAVLSILDFYAFGDSARDFLRAVRDFIESSHEEGMQKIVIDVQQNQGGSSLLAMETFRLFFPSMEPFAGSQRRTHPMADALGTTLTNYWSNMTVHDDIYASLSSNEWVVTDRLDAATGRNFTSWEDFYGPAVFYDGDGFTKTELYNISSPLFAQEAAGINMNSEGAPSQGYDAEDIIILSDGLCSSACTIFMEMMHHEAGVRTVAVGGRPATGPMQAASGSRGANVYTTYAMGQDIDQAHNIDDSTWHVLPNRTLGFDIAHAAVNPRSQVRSDDSAIPLQFVYEPADCRIFYTPHSWFNYTQLWMHAADAAWRDPSICVVNSTGQSSQAPPPPPDRPVVDKLTQAAFQELESSIRLNDHANDILSQAYAMKPIEGKRCTEHYDCGSGFRCNDVYVCQDGKRLREKQCCSLCARPSECGNDRMCYPASSLEREQTFRTRALSRYRETSGPRGYCGPPRLGYCDPGW